MKCGAIKYDDKLLDKKEGEAKVFTLLFWCDFEFKFGFLLVTEEIYLNISSVVAFQRWWVLKGKLLAQESTCLKEILIPTTLNHL